MALERQRCQPAHARPRLPPSTTTIPTTHSRPPQGRGLCDSPHFASPPSPPPLPPHPHCRGVAFVTAPARRGDTVIQVSSTDKLPGVGEWVLLMMDDDANGTLSTHL